ncbi:MAG: hypothetical protein MJB57_07745 [Gemmatimonadetes bacterium]|nr:hypothetical protein [Gemmatimonadota bacterium]
MIEGTDAVPRFQWFAAGLAIIHAALALLVFEPILFPGEDNAAYLILGESLRSGEGYRDLNLPGSPLHAKYPPLFPALLALTGAIGGVQASKLAMLVFTSCAVFVTALLGRRLVGDRPALLATAVLAVNPPLLEYGHYVLSEAPFVLFVVLALLGWHRGGARGAAIAIGAATAAFATRTAGFTVLLAICFGWAFQRAWRYAAIAAGVTLLAVVGWGGYQAWAAPHQPNYLEELLLVDPYTPAAGSLDLAGLVVRAATNAWAYVSLIIPDMTVETDGVIGRPAMVVGVLLSALALLGWVTRTRRAFGAAECFVLLYSGLIAVWPDVWTDRRFLLPVFPLLLLLIFEAIGRLGRARSVSEASPDPEASAPELARRQGRGRRLRDRRVRLGRLAPVAVLVFLLVPSAMWVVRQAPERLRCSSAYRVNAGCDLPEYASLYAAGIWARENTRPDAIIVNRKPRLFYWFSRRQGDLYPYSAEPTVVMDALDRMSANYVVVDQVSATTARYLVPAIQTYQARFEPVYRAGEPPTFIFRIHPASSTAQ